MALPLREGVALARELADALLESEEAATESESATEYGECGPECECAK